MSHGHPSSHGGWDQHAHEYDHAMAVAESELSHVSASLLDATATGARTRLLDLACGPGHTTAAATARGAHALGIDLSIGMVGVARTRYPRAKFQVADMLDPPAGPWDAVVSRFGVHHADPAWATAAFKVLKPGGRIAIAEKVADSAEDTANGMRPADHWVQLLQETGFTDVKVSQSRAALSKLAAGHGHSRHFRDMAVAVVSGMKPPEPR